MKNVLKQENKYVSKELKSKIQKAKINDYFEKVSIRISKIYFKG